MHCALIDAHPSAHDIAHHLWLLENLLEHEVLVPALLDFFEAEVELRDLFMLLDIFNRLDRIVIPGDNRHLSVRQINHLFGVFDDRSSIGSDEILTVTKADHERTAFSRNHDSVRLTRGDNADTVSALDMAERLAHRAFQTEHRIGFPDAVDQMNKHL